MELDKKPEDNIVISPANILIDGVEHLYQFINTVYNEKITAINIVLVTTQLVQLVEKYKSLTGYQKKMVVISVVKKLVNSQMNTEDDKRAMNTIIEYTLPSIIDNLVNAINGNLKFNKDKSVSFFKKYICCCLV